MEATPRRERKEGYERMPPPQSDNARLDVYLNDDQFPIVTPNYQLYGLQQAWEKQGRHVQVFAYEDERPGLSYSRPKLRVIVEPPPTESLDKEWA